MTIILRYRRAEHIARGHNARYGLSRVYLTTVYCIRSCLWKPVLMRDLEQKHTQHKVTQYKAGKVSQISFPSSSATPLDYPYQDSLDLPLFPLVAESYRAID